MLAIINNYNIIMNSWIFNVCDCILVIGKDCCVIVNMVTVSELMELASLVGL